MAEIPRPAPCRVLVVDDYPDTAETMAMLLKLWGHDVRVAHDGPAALAAAGSYRPEVVFLDIGMPGMDGFEVARRLRRQPDLEGVLLVSLSGHAREEDRRRALAAGCDAYLVKPVEPDDLKQLLEGCGRRLRRALEAGNGNGN